MWGRLGVVARRGKMAALGWGRLDGEAEVDGM